MPRVSSLKTAATLAAVADLPAASAPIVSNLATFMSELGAMFPEREAVIHALTVAAVAGETVFLLGRPGVAKSALVRTFTKACHASYFEYLLAASTDPSELFGPVDVQAFKSGRYARVTAGKLPTAQVAFLDEVWKGSGAIVNTLLTILNEKIYDAGSGPVAVPLLTCVGASNEIPEDLTALAAIYDRFLVRIVVKRIQDSATRRALWGKMAKRQRPSAPTVGLDLVAEQAAASAVDLTDDTLDALNVLADKCIAAGIEVSDRRWMQCQNLLRAVAHVDGRTATEPEDITFLENVIWQKPDEQPAVSRLVAGVASPDGAQAVALLDAARDIATRLPSVGQLSSDARDAGAMARHLGTCGSSLAQARDIEKKLADLRPSRKVDAARAEVSGLVQTIGGLALIASGVRS